MVQSAKAPRGYATPAGSRSPPLRQPGPSRRARRARIEAPAHQGSVARGMVLAGPFCLLAWWAIFHYLA